MGKQVLPLEIVDLTRGRAGPNCYASISRNSGNATNLLLDRNRLERAATYFPAVHSRVQPCCDTEIPG